MHGLPWLSAVSACYPHEGEEKTVAEPLAQEAVASKSRARTRAQAWRSPHWVAELLPPWASEEGGASGRGPTGCCDPLAPGGEAAT